MACELLALELLGQAKAGAAYKKYRDQVLEVTGVVEPLNKASLTLHGAKVDDRPTVNCFFVKDEWAKIAKVAEGQKAVVRGTFAGHYGVSGNVELKECRLVNVVK